MDSDTPDAGTAQDAPALPPPGTPPTAPDAAASSPDPRIEAANREAAKYRRELRELQAWKEQQEAAQLSEAQRLQRAAETAEGRAAAAEQRARAAELRVAVLTHAPTVALLPAAYDDALKLLNPDLIEWDADTGLPTRASVKRALEALVKDRPYLIASPTAPPPGPSAFAPTSAARPAAEVSAYQAHVSGQW